MPTSDWECQNTWLQTLFQISKGLWHSQANHRRLYVCLGEFTSELLFFRVSYKKEEERVALFPVDA